MRAETDFAVDDDAESAEIIKALFDISLPKVLVDAAADAVRDGTMACITRITAEGQLEIERLFSLDAPSLEALSHILRHKELWPSTFSWDFSVCEACALGLAHSLWRLQSQYPAAIGMNRLVSDDMSLQFAMPMAVAQRIFGGSELNRTYGVYSTYDVTPEMVADQIDKYLASR